MDRALGLASLGVICIAAFFALVIIWALPKVGWKRMLGTFLIYTTEGALAVTGFCYGFGLEVRSWVWLIGTLILARFCYHCIIGAIYAAETAEHHKRLFYLAKRDYDSQAYVGFDALLNSVAKGKATVYSCSNLDCGYVSLHDKSLCPVCHEKGLTWTLYPTKMAVANG